MNKINFRKIYNSDFSQLRIIINSWEFYDFTSNDEFDSLNNKILSHLYKNADSEKLSRIIQSELNENYELIYDDLDAEKLTDEVFKWWQNKN